MPNSLNSNLKATSEYVASAASRGLTDPHSLTEHEIKSVCASALSQRPTSELDILQRVLIRLILEHPPAKTPSGFGPKVRVASGSSKFRQ